MPTPNKRWPDISGPQPADGDGGLAGTDRGSVGGRAAGIDLSEAIDRYRTSPDELIMEQVDLLWQRGRQQQAVELLREALKQEPDNVELKVALADKLLQLDRGEDARAVGKPAGRGARPPTGQRPAGAAALRRSGSGCAGSGRAGKRCAPIPPTAPPAGNWRPARAGRRLRSGAGRFMDLMRRDPQFEDEAGRRG